MLVLEKSWSLSGDQAGEAVRLEGYHLKAIQVITNGLGVVIQVSNDGTNFHNLTGQTYTSSVLVSDWYPWKFLRPVSSGVGTAQVFLRAGCMLNDRPL